MLLLVVTIKVAPPVLGVRVAGLIVQVGGGAVGPAAQLKLTAALYPLAAVNFPENVMFWLTHPDCGELLMVSV